MTIQNIHATAISLHHKGVLIRGPSGAGKSLLALLLIDAFLARGREAMLVADDRVDLKASDDCIWLSPPENIAGLIELRGRGIVRRPHRETVRLDLIVDLVPALERMPEINDFRTMLLNREIARCPVPQVGVIGIEHQRLLIEEALSAIHIPTGA